MRLMRGRNADNRALKLPKPETTIKAMAKLCAQEVTDTIPLVMRFIRREMRSQGEPSLSVSQLRTLFFLNCYPGMDLSSVADHLGVTRPTASVIVNRLVQQGLVNRTEHPQERRCVVLTLTRTGSQRLRYVREAVCSLMANIFANRPPEELHKIEEGIALLGKVFKEVS